MKLFVNHTSISIRVPRAESLSEKESICLVPKKSGFDSELDAINGEFAWFSTQL